MARKAHPLALFSLVPENEKARTVAASPDNAHLAHEIDFAEDDRRLALDVGFHIQAKGRYMLATIGRNDADITIADRSISRLQCSFEIHPESRAVMVFDRSTSQRTKFFGPTAISFERGRSPRRVVVREGVNELLVLGGNRGNGYIFRLFWHSVQKVDVQSQVELQCDNFRLARTLDNTETVAPSGMVTRIHTPCPSAGKIRYAAGDIIGTGSFGRVITALNIDSGELLAVKRIALPAPDTQERDRDLQDLKREVNTLRRIEHQHIVNFIGAQRSDDGHHLEIFTPKLEGNLEALISKDIFYDNAAVLSLLKQMLQALDYLTTQNIIHRDVKPENILFQRHSYGLHYQLIDFGLSNAASLARTHGIGSPLFMAPEIWNAPNLQSCKVDIWSLFVTLVWASDMPRGTRRRMKGVRSRSLVHALREIQGIVSVAAQDGYYGAIRDMAAVEPGQRPSAGDLLSRHFDAEGRMSVTNLEVIHFNEQVHPVEGEKGPVLSKQKLKESKEKGSFVHRTSLLEARSGIARRRAAMRRQPKNGFA